MTMLKSKGLMIFLVVLFTFTVLNTINVKKCNESIEDQKDTYVATSKETSILS